MLINPTGDLGKFTQNGRFQEITVNYQTSKIKKKKRKNPQGLQAKRLSRARELD